MEKDDADELERKEESENEEQYPGTEGGTDDGGSELGGVGSRTGERTRDPFQDEGYALWPRATGPRTRVSFFFNRISSSSGDARSCWKVVKMAFCCLWLVEFDDC